MVQRVAPAEDRLSSRARVGRLIIEIYFLAMPFGKDSGPNDDSQVLMSPLHPHPGAPGQCRHGGGILGV